jgi:DNA-binding NarL/FixJ family response regulator
MAVDAPIRIAIADDHALFRQGLNSLLRSRDDVVVVGETDRVDGLDDFLERTLCDVLLLDLQMERSAVADVRTAARRVHVVIVTANEYSDEPLAAMRAGARGVVFKRFAIEMLLEAVHAVMEGNVWMPPALQARLAGSMREADRQHLTPRELEVVRQVAMGLKNGDIARQLFISEETVKAHLSNVFGKLGVRDRVELALHALRAGLVALHPAPGERHSGSLPRKS